MGFKQGKYWKRVGKDSLISMAGEREGKSVRKAIAEKQKLKKSVLFVSFLL